MNKTQARVYSGKDPIGSRANDPKSKGRTYQIYAKDFTSVAQAEPVPLVYGSAQVCGTQITPIWGFRAEKTYSDAGKEKVQTGWNYYGSFALVLAWGPVTALWKIEMGETVIWQDSNTGNGGFTEPVVNLTTDIGSMRFYWGDEYAWWPIDSALSALQINGSTVPFPKMRGLCYVVCENVNFGSQPTPPILKFTISRVFDGVLFRGMAGTLGTTIQKIKVIDGGSGYDPAKPPLLYYNGGIEITPTISGGALVGTTITDLGYGWRKTDANDENLEAFYPADFPMPWNEPILELIDPTGAGTGASLYTTHFDDDGTERLPGDPRIVIVSGGSNYSSSSYIVAILGCFSKGWDTLTPTIENGIITAVTRTPQPDWPAKYLYPTGPTPDHRNWTGLGYLNIITKPLKSRAGSGAVIRASAWITTSDEVQVDLPAGCTIPDIIHDAFTNSIYGFGISVDSIDQASFDAAKTTLNTEGNLISPVIDESLTMRELIGKLLEYIDGSIYIKDSKICIKLHRDEAASKSYSENDLLEEPEPNIEGWDDAYNMTVLRFKDCENKWEESTEGYDDPAAAEITGERTQQEISMPWCIYRAKAQILANRLGAKAALPARLWTLKLKSSNTDVNVGDVIAVSFSKLYLTSKKMRVKKLTISSPEEPCVQLECLEEFNRSVTNDYTPTDDDIDVPDFIDEDGNSSFAITPATPRIAALPSALKDGKADGFMVCPNRTSSLITAWAPYFTWHPTLSEYKCLGRKFAFPVAAEVMWWQRYGSNHVIRIKVATSHDQTALGNMITGGIQLCMVTGKRLVSHTSPKDQHQIVPLWIGVADGGQYRAAAFGGDMWDIEIVGGKFGTAALAYETTLADAVYPTTYLYLAPLADFFIYTTDLFAFDQDLANSPADSGKVRYVKVVTENPQKIESVSDVTAVNFARSSTTMNPDGSYSRDWGSKGPTTSEAMEVRAGAKFDGTDNEFDSVEDVDLALGRTIDRLQSATETTWFDEANRTLGRQFDVKDLLYNPDL